MNRQDLEHIIRAAADVTNEYEFVIVGSQSILGPIPYPPEVFKMSAEADIYPRDAEDKSTMIRSICLNAVRRGKSETSGLHDRQMFRPS